MTKVIAALKSIFDFSRPAVTEFETVDLVVKNRPLLMLTFSFQRKYTIRIGRIGPYRMTEGTLVVKLTQDIDEVRIRISNLWRSNIYTVALKHVRMEEAIMATLIQELFPMRMPDVEQLEIRIDHLDPIMFIPEPILALSNISPTIPTIFLNQEQIAYDCIEQRVL